MKERPIIFSTEMIQAMFDGRKKQTRRVIKPQPVDHHWNVLEGYKHHMKLIECQGGQFLYSSHSRNGRTDTSEESNQRILCPYGVPGDLLYVREAFAPKYFDDGKPAWRANWSEAAADVVPEPKWKPSIHMPKDIARIWLKVKDVRVERIQDITAEDIENEGIRIPVSESGNALIQLTGKYPPANYLEPGELADGKPPLTQDRLLDIQWQSLWDSINAGRGYAYEDNPWVWVVEFSVLSTNGMPELNHSEQTEEKIF